MTTIQRTDADITLTSNSIGILYWHLFIDDATTSAISLEDLKLRIKLQDTDILTSFDIINNIQGVKVDQRVGIQFKPTIATPVVFDIEGMHPETDY
jgi:hypothetical protein